MYHIERMYRPNGAVIQQHERNGLEYLTFPLLEETGVVKHLFSTRMGGVSEGIWGTMNLSFQRGDNPEHVLENFKRIGEVLGISPDDMVTSKQTHTTRLFA